MSLQFTQGTRRAVCSPTRAAFMTGRYRRESPITWNDDISFRDYITINERQSVGYVSALIGKWHLTGDYEKRQGLQLHGFDQVVASETKYIGPGDYFHPYFFMPEMPARDRANT